VSSKIAYISGKFRRKIFAFPSTRKIHQQCIAMSQFGAAFASHGFDAILHDLRPLKRHKELSDPVDAYLKGDYRTVLQSPLAQKLFGQLLGRLFTEGDKNASNVPWDHGESDEISSAHALLTGLAAFGAFLQANVTGPPLSTQSLLFSQVTEPTEISSTRNRCLKNLDVDGLSVYQHIPHVELFSLARAVFTEYFPLVAKDQVYDSKWMRIRINAYHQRLLSSGTSNARLSDSALSLQTQIEADLFALEAQILDPKLMYSTEAKVQFLLEKAQIFIMQGLDLKARENLQTARTVSHFSYALSGALGKRTKFQEKDTSQLVVFAKSNEITGTTADFPGPVGSNGLSPISSDSQATGHTSGNGPIALDLNDDTLLESIEFSKSKVEKLDNSALPPGLANLKPDEQPQLNPLDQIILLTEATIKDTLSPLDKLNSEEILPYAVRVLNDKPTNWQIYTQALLVRSRIESHRSRTQERSVLQLQVIVDQIIAETQEDTTIGGSHGIPQIQVTQFLPRAKSSESAPVTERLRYIHQLNTPTRWEIETELAYAWSSAGSLVSALEIFERLQLWSEVALCYHSVGQEDKARQIVRRQLYFSSRGPGMDHFTVDAGELITEKWDGVMRSPSPPHAPRLWCILGDLDQDPECWQRAWEISRYRYARAQRTLGEYYTRQGDLTRAREAYMKATVVNRQNGETWSRLGDIDLRAGNWDGAIIAFQQSIMIDDSDAKTYSNLGSALLSKHAELMELRKVGTETLNPSSPNEAAMEDENIDDKEILTTVTNERLKPKDILRQALIAYKRGASIAHSNWQIWDNVITIAGRMSPPSFPDILLAMRAIIRIRGPTVGENAIDIDILRGLVGEVISVERISGQPGDAKIYSPPRGSLAKAVIDMVETEIVPLVTTRAAVWSLVEKLKSYCRDYAGALACAEKAWRIATAGNGWLESEEQWKSAAGATDALVSAFENYGLQEAVDGQGEVEKGWRGKARSAVRGVLGKAKDVWEGTEEFEMLKGRLEDLKSA
jgi:tetratricopeptide (TPR) repeat protein